MPWCETTCFSGETAEYQPVRTVNLLLTSNMPLMIGLTMAASRSTTNSKASADTRVMYLLGTWFTPVPIFAAMMADHNSRSAHLGT